MLLTILYVVIPAVITVANLGLGAYLLYQFDQSLNRNTSRKHWGRLWAAGLILFLIGSPVFLLWLARLELFFPQLFLWGFLLILTSTALYAVAAWRCCWQSDSGLQL